MIGYIDSLAGKNKIPWGCGMIIRVQDDLDLEKIENSGQCFRWMRMDHNTWRILSADACLYISALGNGHYAMDCCQDAFERRWKDYLDLDVNYASIRARIDPGEDPFLWAAAEHGKGIRILRQDPWETLVTFIISQNRNIPAIRRSVEALCTLCGEEKTDSRGMPYHAFPTPFSISSHCAAELSPCRLGYRDKYVLRAARDAAAGRIRLDDLRNVPCSEAVARLETLYGVGNKVACCAALFGLHQLDAFPRDVWINRALADEYPDGWPLEKYRPFNGVYQQYIFAYIRAQNGK